MLAPYLGSTSWHIREEVLQLMMVSFLKHTNDFDYYTIVDSIAKLLDDPKSKIKFTCREALASLALKGQKNRVTEILYEKVEPKEYNSLCDRFDQGNCPKFYEDTLVFEYPINTAESRSRMSSRGSNFSESSRRSEHKAKSTRSRIGDSPLTYKGFVDQNKVQSTAKDYGNLTVADNYKHGPTPSERMKKFNTSQVPLVKSSKRVNPGAHDYSNSGVLNNSNGMERKPQDLTNNLRLLKNKIRTGSASSNGSDPYTNIKIASKESDRTQEFNFRKTPNNSRMNSFEQNGIKVIYAKIINF